MFTCVCLTDRVLGFWLLSAEMPRNITTEQTCVARHLKRVRHGEMLTHHGPLTGTDIDTACPRDTWLNGSVGYDTMTCLVT